MKVPFIVDPRTGKQSITITFPLITFIVAVCSVIAFHFYPEKLFIPTTTAIYFWFLSLLMYQIRKIQKSVISLKSQTIELTSGEPIEK